MWVDQERVNGTEAHGSSSERPPGQAPGWPFRCRNTGAIDALAPRPLAALESTHRREGPRSPATGSKERGGVPGRPMEACEMARRRIYEPRIVADHIMTQDDFDRLHDYLIETERIPEASEDVRKVVEDEWPELMHKLPPKDRTQ
jgi:hypothetical protein